MKTEKLWRYLFEHPSPWVFRPYCLVILTPVAFGLLGMMEAKRWPRNVGREVLYSADEIAGWTADAWRCFSQRLSAVVRVGWCKPSDRDAYLDRIANQPKG